MSDTPRVDVLCDPHWHDLLVHEAKKLERELADVPRQIVNSRLEGWRAGMGYAAKLCDSDEVCEGSVFAKAIRAQINPASVATRPPAAQCSEPAER